MKLGRSLAVFFVIYELSRHSHLLASRWLDDLTIRIEFECLMKLLQLKIRIKRHVLMRIGVPASGQRAFQGALGFEMKYTIDMHPTAHVVQ